MTALIEYQRLEATAIWRPDPEAQRRDVYVSLGNATLIIHDGKDVALSHWSLPAVIRRNPGSFPPRYAPGEDSPEEIEITDTTMIEAIERVRKSVERGRPHPGRLRTGIVVTVALAVAAAAVFWIPVALMRQTATIVPDATRAAISSAMMAELRPLTGPACDTPQGQRALTDLTRRLLPDAGASLVVVPDAIRAARHLPDGTILLGRELVEDYHTPDVVAGHILAEAERIARTDPLEAMLKASGIGTTLRLLTSGTLSPEAVKAAALRLVAMDDPRPLDAEALVPRFAGAGVPLSPYAYALDGTGETTLPLIESDPVPASTARPILNDDAWVALQNICGS